MKILYTKKIYFTAKDISALKKIFENARGVIKISAGNISARNVFSQVNPEPHKIENISGVEIEFNPKKTDLSTLMDIFFDEFNPYADNNSGIYYLTGEDEPQIELHMNFIATYDKQMISSSAHLTINDPNSKPVQKCYASAGRLVNFEVENDS